MKKESLNNSNTKHQQLLKYIDIPLPGHMDTDCAGAWRGKHGTLCVHTQG